VVDPIAGPGRYDFSPIIDRPDFEWPGGARLATYVAINVECFAYGGGGASLTPGMDPPNAPHRTYGWRDYGMRVGVWRLLDELAERSIVPTVLLNGYVPQMYPSVATALQASGAEIVGHGRTNSEMQGGMALDEERTLIAESTELLVKAFGRRPQGWMSPGATQSANTLDLLAEAGYTYSLDWPMDDQPVWMRSSHGPVLSVPYPLESNDYPQVLSRGHTGRQFARIARDQFRELHRQSAKQPLVFPLSLHTFVAGQPHRLDALRRVLDAMAAGDKVWATTPGAIAEYYTGLFPAPAEHERTVAE
jgi:allantoinase